MRYVTCQAEPVRERVRSKHGMELASCVTYTWVGGAGSSSLASITANAVEGLAVIEGLGTRLGSRASRGSSLVPRLQREGAATSSLQLTSL